VLQDYSTLFYFVMNFHSIFNWAYLGIDCSSKTCGIYLILQSACVLSFSLG